MRRASTGRRRLGSADSNVDGTCDDVVHKHLRSRSQERSVGFTLDKHSSRASSTAGSEGDDLLEELDPLEEPYPKSVTLMNGQVNDVEVIITGKPNKQVRSEKYHRRSVSDPFDIPGYEGGDTSTDTPLGRPAALPTLPRYPVAETRDLNCWSEPPVDIFKVRGPNYLHDKKKVPSDHYLVRARGLDLLLFPNEGAGDTVNMMDRSTALLNGTLRSKPTLVLNFRFPWGLMLLHFEIPEILVPFLQKVPKDQHHPSHIQHSDMDCPSLDSLSTGERTLAMWIMGDENYKNQRLKLIPYVVQGPWIVRNLVTGKPAIIGTKLPVSYRVSNNLLVAELDIGNGSATAKRIVSICRRYMNALTCDIGFVIQSNTQEELPEQMLGAIRIHGVDPLKAPTFS